MSKQFNLGISVTTNAKVTGERIAEIVRWLIDAGLADAQRTVDADEGDLESAELATDLNIRAPAEISQETSIQVMHWNAYQVDGAVHTHQFEIDDQRNTNGQAFITVGALEGNLDEMLSVTMEVNTNPLNGIDHVPCAHVHFDSDALAVSLFKIGDKILVRPETGVSIASFVEQVNGSKETLYWIE